MERISIHDLELADVVQDKLLRRRRLRDNVVSNGTFSEEEYAHLVATEVERAQRAVARLMEKQANAQ